MSLNLKQIINRGVQNQHLEFLWYLYKRIPKAEQMAIDGITLWGYIFRDTCLCIIKRQSSEDRYNICFLRANGSYGCYQDINRNSIPCIGLPNYYKEREYWNYARPCKHILAMVANFHAQVNEHVQKILEDWLIVAIRSDKRPRRKDEGFSVYVLNILRTGEIGLPSPLESIDQNNSSKYMFYEPLDNVRITNGVNYYLHLHFYVAETGIDNVSDIILICSDCRKKMNKYNPQKNEWLFCKVCYSLFCADCLKQHTTNEKESICFSYYLGKKKHAVELEKLDWRVIDKTKVKTKPKKNTVLDYFVRHSAGPSYGLNFDQIIEQQNTFNTISWLTGLKIKFYELGGTIETITELDLSNKSIKILPDFIGEFKSLELINLENNKLIELPNILKELKYLKELNLRKNKLPLFPELLFDIPELEKLDLSANKLKEFPNEINLAKLKKLKVLKLGSNNLKEIPQSLFNIKTLNQLTLNDNKIKVVPEEIKQLSALRRLDLSNNRLKHVPKSLFNLPKISLLNLKGNVKLPEALLKNTRGNKNIRALADNQE